MRFYPLLLIFISLAVWQCAPSGSTENKNDENPNALSERHGGVFKYNETEYFRSLYPLNITEVVGHRITNQLYEGMVSLDPADLSVKPSLAESWEVNDSATEYTFKIRKGVYFHDDPCFEGGKGRELKAQDFEYCLTKLCEPAATNQGYWVVQNLLKGADQHYEAVAAGEESAGVSGIEVIDDYTLKITLERAFAGFLYKMALPFTEVFPREAFEKYGDDMREKAVGTGPFQVKRVLPDESVILVRNENYWGKDEAGTALPYLDGIKISFIKEEKTELLEFKQGNFHMKYRLPYELIPEILDSDGGLTPEYAQFQLQEATEMTVQYYGFLHTHPIFSNLKVRQAFNYAIDRQEIVDYVVKGAGIPAFSGIVPHGFPFFKNESVKGYNFDPEKARSLLAEAGFEGGKGFPKTTLQINSGGGRNEQVAEAVQKMLEETLNIDIEITQVVWAQHSETIETGKVGFWRLGWVADYPDPENFLNLFHSKHVPESPTDKAYINSFRYKSAEFDAIFDQSMETINDEERNRLYEQADQIAMNDAVVLPIFYSKNNRLLQAEVRNFPQNPMEYRSFREVYFEK